ncbi:hypothetical protein N3Z17_07470 (plasmid) [Candidatus Bandiella numerosa]|jgi:hypothetical protein|uniref:hypothetical protein n=1 Tax=Candidatus Bandiella numerosa TaxID=2570586 RepID=UPI00249E0B1B|nr:hypothetical protein [Candidatus Bandiella numerosa]WHA05671.1 hypothetical protein N3Z17_07470 [Candidatus Bandiella numerosa]
MSYKAKKILTVILFLFLGTMVFSKSIRSFFADDTMKLITEHKEKIGTVGAKHKSYVTRKIDEARKMFDELDDGMSQYKYGNKIMKDENIWEAKRVGDIEYKNIRNQYLNIFRKEAQQLEKVKNTLRDEGITETDFIQDERYRKAIVYAFEQIGFMFSSHAVRFFTECDQFEADSGRYTNPQCDTFYNHISKKYFDSGYVSEKLNYLTQLKKEMGNAFLISDERERVNRITVLHNNITSVYFTEVEEDNEIRLARYATENAAKALLPYKRFIFEILNAQRKLNNKIEIEEFFMSALKRSCVNGYMDNRYISGEKSIKDAIIFCEDWLKDHKNSGSSDRVIGDRIYHSLDYYLSGKTLIKFLESYKDFGVNDNE